MPHVNSLLSGYTVRENGLWLSDTTTGNATISRHGLLPKLPNDATKFLDGTGAWAAAGGSLTKRIPIIGAMATLDASGDIGVETYDVLGTNDIFKQLVFRFGANNAAQPTVKSGFYSCFHVPHDYAGNAKVIVPWTSTLTTGDVVWSFAYREVTGNDSESMDQTTSHEAPTVTDTAPGAANRRLEASISLTSANLSADDAVEYLFRRDGDAAGDTLAGSAILFDLLFEYTT